MDNRQKQLLKVIVETYVKSVKPVGSKSLCEKFNLSSATIRNEMAILEDLGYIEKNHISSGRIPSEKGYRYYVDELLKDDNISLEEIKYILQAKMNLVKVVLYFYLILKVLEKMIYLVKSIC